MFVRQCYRRVNGKRHAYWALVESYRTGPRGCPGPRQRVAAYLGRIDEAGRLGVREAAEGGTATERQRRLFDEPERQPRWVEVNASAVRVENCRQFGGPWLALELIRRLGLDAFFEQVMPRGQEQETVPWSVSALILIIARLCEPSSELYIAEQWYPKTALAELLGAPARSIDDNRLYRAWDQLLPHKEDWREVRDGVEVKLCASPDGDDETFILCRSRDRSQKDLAVVRRIEQKIEARLTKMAARCDKQKRDPQKVEREVGRLLGQNTRAAGLFDVEVKPDENGQAKMSWKKITDRRDWATLSAGCDLLRSNVTDWSDEDLWKAYMQLTEAEAAFRIHKSDLSIRPIWRQKEDRVLAHILVCFLAYVLWKTPAALCRQAGLGDEPRRVLDELAEIRAMEVVLPTREGVDIRRRCVSKPSDHQTILLHHLGLTIKAHRNVVKIQQTQSLPRNDLRQSLGKLG